MIKNLMTKLLLGKTLEEIKTNSFNDGIRFEKEKRHQEKLDTDKWIISNSIGMKGIYISNEWVDPTFFIITDIDYITGNNLPVYKYLNVLTNESGMALIRTVLPADEEMVQAVLKLNPFERWNMCTSKNTLSNMWSKSYPLGNITDSDTLYKRLKEVNFI